MSNDALQLAVCNWTFSLRVSTGSCCNSLGCEQIGSCDDVAVGICLRNPDTLLEDIRNCPAFFTGSGSDIIGTVLTPDDDMNVRSHKMTCTSLIMCVNTDTDWSWRHYKL